MGRIILLILLFISVVSLGQTNSTKYSRDADTAQMIIQTTKSGGIVKYLLITGTDTAQIRWDGTALLIEGYNIVDSTNLQTDTLKDHRVQINKNMDSLALHLDTLQAHRTDINAKVDSTNIRLYNTGRSVFIGEGAGVVDNLGNNENTFTGYNSGNANTTGEVNAAYGAYSLAVSEDGVHNTALGNRTLLLLTSGSNNTAIGSLSLSSITINAENVGVGYESLLFLSSGQRNTAIGTDAGMHIVSGNLTTGSNHTLIGYDAKVSANSTTNETVVGYDADGQGTNKAVFGNSATTDVYMNDVGTAIVHAGEYILGTDYKIIIFNDTMCGVKISTTDTVRIVPTR